MSFTIPKPTDYPEAGDQYVVLYTNQQELIDTLWDEAAVDADVTAALALKMNEPYNQTFDDTDLVTNVLTVAHGRGRHPASIMIYNNLNQVMVVPTTATATEVVVTFSGAITGTWRLVIS